MDTGIIGYHLIRRLIQEGFEVGSEVEPEWGAIPHRGNEVWFTCADISRTENFLGWQPKIQISGDGLELTVECYKDFWRRE